MEVSWLRPVQDTSAYSILLIFLPFFVLRELFQTVPFFLLSDLEQ